MQFINTGLGKVTETSVSAQLRNLDFFHIFFELIQKGNCDPRFQLALFKQLNRFIQSSTRLKIYCCQNAWLLRLLQMLPSIDDAAVLGTDRPPRSTRSTNNATRCHATILSTYDG